MVAGSCARQAILPIVVGMTLGSAQGTACDPKEKPRTDHKPSVQSDYQPERDVRGRPVVGADLPGARTSTIGPLRLVVPVTPPGGPRGVELELDVLIEGLEREPEDGDRRR